jgi:hypothetical protein
MHRKPAASIVELEVLLSQLGGSDRDRNVGQWCSVNFGQRAVLDREEVPAHPPHAQGVQRVCVDRRR